MEGLEFEGMGERKGREGKGKEKGRERKKSRSA